MYILLTFRVLQNLFFSKDLETQICLFYEFLFEKLFAFA
jgi:hypothetical protein